MSPQYPLHFSKQFATLLIVLATAACQGSPSAPVVPAPAAAGGPEAKTVEADVELGAGPLNLPDPRLGLADLSSYRSTLTISFQGTQGGTSAQWSSTYEYLSSGDPAARQLTIKSSGDTSEPALQYMAERDGTAYTRLGDEACVAGVLDPDASFTLRLEPAALLTGLLGADEAGHESLDGVQADHYSFDERALAQAGLNDSSGEIWLASDGGYVVRYTLTTTAGTAYFGEGTEGALSWDYRLSDINLPVALELPEDCPPGMVDAPMLPDAANVSSAPGVLEYETASTVAEARAFYEQELTKLGWSAPESQDLAGVLEGTPEEIQRALEMMQAMGLSQPTPTPDPNEAFVVFSQAGRTLDVILTRADSTTEVLLLLGRSAE